MTNTFSPQVTTLLQESAGWRLLGLLFEYPTAAWRESLVALIPDLADESQRSMAEAALQFHTEGLHFALFGPAGSVPVREVAYQGGVQSGYLMSELSAYYRSFGYTPTAEEPADHLAIELGFVSYLKMKQALSLACEECEPAAIAAQAATGFTKDHLAVMGEPLSLRLPEFGPDYLTEAGRTLVQWTGPAPRSSYPLAAASLGEVQDDDFGCGSSTAGSDVIPIEDLSITRNS